MNPLNLFILISQLSLGLYVAASPSVAQRAPEKLCDTSQTYAGKLFNLYTTQADGEKLMISKDGILQVGGKNGYPFIATFTEKPTGSEAWHGNLKVKDAENILSQNGYLSSRPHRETSGGGYTFRFGVPPKNQPAHSKWEPGVTFGFVCENGSPILVAKNIHKGSEVMGCDAKGGGKNIVFGVKADSVFNRRCHHKIPLYIAFIS